MIRKLMRLGVPTLILVFATMMLNGCRGTGDAQKSELQKVTTINISGSTSVQPISEVLAQAYMDKNQAVKIFVQGGGSSAGIKAVQEGAADIGCSSRDLKPEEKNLVETVIAKDGIAIVINPANKVQNLTLAQIKGIYDGTIVNWKEVGGDDQAIDVVTREEGSGTRGAFEELVMGKETKIKASAIVQNSTGAIRTTVAGNPKAVGYVSLTSLNESVKEVTVDGIAPSAATVLDGSYQISRPFLYLTKSQPTGEVKMFIDFILSPEGQTLIEKEGLVKLK